MNLEKIKEEFWDNKFPDPQERRVITRCSYTGLEIYEGEQYILLPNGGALIDDIEILIAYINGQRVTAGEEVY